jgi:lipopolysaccharide transport system ATP-binding protein
MNLFKRENENLRRIFPSNYLNDGQYFMDLYILKKENKIECLFYQSDILRFDVLPEERNIGDFMGNEPGVIRQKYKWEEFV